MVADLDALLSESVVFRLGGERHVINPVSTGTLFEFQKGWAQLRNAFEKKADFDAETLIDAYTRVIGSVCSSIKRSHIENMTQAQLAALFKLVMSTITGEVYVKDEPEKVETKKKTPKKRTR